MNRIRVTGTVMVFLAGCSGAAVEQRAYPGGSAGAVRGSAGVGGVPGTAGMPAVLDKLVVDTPHDHSTVTGVVQISGSARGFVNIEVWDATHGKSTAPLAHATPAGDGSFTTQVDTGALAPGATTWTIWGWDTPAGTPSTQSDAVALSLTIASATPTSGSAGQLGAGGGTGGSGAAARNYLLGFFPDRKTDGPYHTWLGYDPEVDYDGSYQDHFPGGRFYPPSIRYPNVFDVDICGASLDYGDVAAGRDDDALTATRDSIPSDWYSYIYAIRIDSEFNLHDPCAGVDAVTYKQAAEHVIALYKAKLPARVKYIWNPNVYHGSNLDSFVPANCDVIGIDAYAQPADGATSQYLFGDQNSPAAGSLWWWTAVARRLGKAIALPEWGDDGADGVYIGDVAAWADDPANNVVYLGYWDSSDNENASLRGASLIAFTKAFADRPYGGTFFAPLLMSAQTPAGF